MRIAIIGSGISGLVCARLLSYEHEVVVLEADSRIGGHTNTLQTQWEGEAHAIDAGFIVYNERTYPNFTRILADLEVATDPTSMSFSVRCDQTGLEYNGGSLDGVFAQRKNLVSPYFLRMLADILRFNRDGEKDLAKVPAEQTVGEYLAEKGYSRQFAEKYLLPMGAAIWSCPLGQFSQFPIRFILEFYVNHGLLRLRDRPTWRVVRGGSQQYVDRLVAPFRSQIRVNCPVRSVRRCHEDVLVMHEAGSERFDEVVFACHSDQALRLLADADDIEQEMLSAFPYYASQACLHTDESVLPRSRRAWASWNYHVPAGDASRPTLTYNMNMLQHIDSRHTFCVTLNEDEAIDPAKVIARFNYSHPLFTTRRAEVQRRHHELIRHRHTSYCGAYWRNGFHEDGVVSALAVCRKFGIGDWSLGPQRPHARSPHVAPSLQAVSAGECA
ncbi:NAD(P)/FAD-dependent oxidoreductase [Blastopirellula marina]|uniref:FAD-dependent oxidoreductase n=1 Tax=Blastopirellula marina TaxID=124 RepID=A0A2S8GNK0_9BACT|nr:FAD-dependent oxidoreductase [Blastopirellula marina]PQO45999.1 FAD-dependent oxidoreductase [Blastopirellula marina]